MPNIAAQTCLHYAQVYAIIVHMDKHRFPLMLPRDIWERIKALAARSRRPVTQEIILAIEEHLEAAPDRKEDNPTP